MTIRKCTIEDIPWIMSNADLWYKGVMTDREKASKWVRKMISDENCIVLRNEYSMAAAEIGDGVFASGKFACFHFFGGKARYLIPIMQHIISWARERRARCIDFTSVTGAKIDKLAKILGARSIPSYSVEV